MWCKKYGLQVSDDSSTNIGVCKACTYKEMIFYPAVFASLSFSSPTLSSIHRGKFV